MRASERVARVEVSDVRSAEDWMRTLNDRYSPPVVQTSTKSGIQARIRSISVGGIILCEITARAHSVGRSMQDIARLRPDKVIVILQLDGEGVIHQGTNHFQLTKGDMTLFDMRQPHIAHYTDDVRLLTIVLPRDRLPQSLVRRRGGSRIDGMAGNGQTVSTLFNGIGDNLDVVGQTSGIRLMHSAIQLLQCVLEPDPATTVSSTTGSDDAMRTSVRLYIAQHVTPPTLTAAKVAKAHEVSLRHLQYLFAQENQTISGIIRTGRLERCLFDLSEPALSKLTIREIGARWGFTDPTHFGRVFRTTYGIGPREYRRSAHDSSAA